MNGMSRSGVGRGPKRIIVRKRRISSVSITDSEIWPDCTACFIASA